MGQIQPKQSQRPLQVGGKIDQTAEGGPTTPLVYFGEGHVDQGGPTT